MLIVDNYDSFTYNIVQYIKILGIEPRVITNDELTLNEVKKIKFSKLLLSPGWGSPENSGITMELIDYYKDAIPILGVCLGMQCIAKYFGADVVKAPAPCHGKVSKIYYEEDFKLFAGLPNGFNAIRYHSLMMDVPSENKLIKVKAKTKDGIPMALEIFDKNIYGVQFHPEGILTEDGIRIFKNFIDIKN